MIEGLDLDTLVAKFGTSDEGQDSEYIRKLVNLAVESDDIEVLMPLLDAEFLFMETSGKTRASVNEIRKRRFQYPTFSNLKEKADTEVLFF